MSFISSTSWYTSDTLGGYLELIIKHTQNNYTFNTDFVVAFTTRWIGHVISWIKEKIFNKNYLFFPCCISNEHWILIVAHGPTESIICYDSKHGKHKKLLSSIYRFLKYWEIQEETNVKLWTIKYGNTPHQDNNYDCGPWVLETARYLAMNQTPIIEENMMPYIRNRHFQEMEISALTLTQVLTHILI